ncbi:putative transposable element, partial [Pseudoloma neurophilia]
MEWNEEQEKKSIILHMKADARSWIAEYLNAVNFEVQLQQLIKDITDRFQSKGKTDMTLTSFIHAPNPKTRNEFKILLRSATKLAEKNMMSLTALAQLIINKVPEAFKALLVDAMEKAGSWHQFLHRAESVCWVAYPDAALNRIENVAAVSTEPQSAIANCLIHGTGTHSTEKCFKIIAFAKREKDKIQRWQERRKKGRKARVDAIEV